MVVYANLCGSWLELGDDDCIDGEPAEMFVNYTLSKNELNSLNKFLRVSHKNLIYNVHISQIQWANDRY